MDSRGALTRASDLDSALLDEIIAWTSQDVTSHATKLHVMANLFGRNVVLERAAEISTDAIKSYVEIVQGWHDDYLHGSLKTDKETSREQAYNQDFFIKILGYTEKRYGHPHTLEPKATTEKRQFPDVLLSYTDPVRNVENIAAVVELKDASTSLDRPQQREGNLSPVQQAFKYKPQYRVCPFVIVSNFYEFRVYNDNQLDYESWTLADLVDPSNDYIKFKTWYYLLSVNNFTAKVGKSVTELLLSDIRIKQREIGERFYAQYKIARENLLRDIWERNPKTRQQFGLAIEKAQTIIDRVVFACFAEDRGLLPDNIVLKVVDYAKNSPVDEPLFSHLTGFFNAIDRGSGRLGIPNGYNGGLFARDEYIETLEISDGPLLLLTELAKYDFHEDALSVKVLGHIFEQSITDIEEIKNKIFVDQYPIGEMPPPATEPGKRKKEGIYYTPDYVVRSIVDNTLGEFLRMREEELKVIHNLHRARSEKGYDRREKAAYLQYQQMLRRIKVLDPACGSGAFLVSVFDYLMAENRRVTEILAGHGEPDLLSDEEYVRRILTDNIFGVDLNEESVEITKLSLWLKTAEKGKKLTALDENVRQGNSLISDKSTAGLDAFAWETEFPKIFETGGFDVVVGNPPYGAEIQERQKEHLKASYETYEYQLNSYSFFYERGLQLLGEGGYLGYITPANFTYQYYFKKLRALLQKYGVSSITKYNFEVFPDASVGDTACLVVCKKPNNGTDIKTRVIDSPDNSDIGFEVRPYSAVVDSDGYFKLQDPSAVVGAEIETVLLGSIATITMGIKPYQVGKGTPKQTREMVRDKVFSSNRAVDDTYKEYLVGGDFDRYRLLGNPKRYLSYGKWLAEPRSGAPFLDDEKIILRQTADSLIGYLDTEQRINLNNVFNVGQVNSKYGCRYLLGLLNTPLLTSLYQDVSQEKGRTFAEVKKNYLARLPIAVPTDAEKAAIEESVDLCLATYRRLREVDEHFKSTLHNALRLKLSEKYSKWWLYPVDELGDSFTPKLQLDAWDDLKRLVDRYRDEAMAYHELAKKEEAKIEVVVNALYGLSGDAISSGSNPGRS